MSAFVYPSLTNSQLSTLPRGAGRHHGWFRRLTTAVRHWRKVSRERAALGELNDRELADFGASTADVYREVNTPFWRIPPTL
jgi:uncharacterized protein YjiS (DUF1127 family)